MKHGIWTFVLCCAVSAVVAQSPPRTPYDTWKESVDRGKEADLFSKCTATALAIDRFLVSPDGHPELEHFHVSVSKTAGEIARVFADARRLYKTPTPADVPNELKTDAVYVFVDPHQPSSGPLPAPIEHIVLKSKDSGLAVQPVAFKAIPVEWGIAAGGSKPPNRATARFETGPVRELPAGDFDVVVITSSGERRCKVGARDRQRLFGGR